MNFGKSAGATPIGKRGQDTFSTCQKKYRPNHQMLSGTPKIIVNLEKVDHIDSGGLGILVGLWISAENRGGELKLVSPNKHVNDVLRRTNLDTVFKMYGNDDEAVAAFRKQVA